MSNKQQFDNIYQFGSAIIWTIRSVSIVTFEFSEFRILLYIMLFKLKRGDMVTLSKP